MDVSAIQAAAAATTANYRSFADATRSVLDLLERHKPGCAVYMAHLDRGQFIHRIVDARNGAGAALQRHLDPAARRGAEIRHPRAPADQMEAVVDLGQLERRA